VRRVLQASGLDLLCARLRHGMKREDAAEAFGVSVDEWRRWERQGPPLDVEGLEEWVRDGLV
jgi:transcriptional regulator with XRE-family HTH domain